MNTYERIAVVTMVGMILIGGAALGGLTGFGTASIFSAVLLFILLVSGELE